MTKYRLERPYILEQYLKMKVFEVIFFGQNPFIIFHYQKFLIALDITTSLNITDS